MDFNYYTHTRTHTHTHTHTHTNCININITIQSIEEELKEKLALKEKLIEDTQFIAAQKHSVKPDKLKEVKSDFEDTWKAIEDQVLHMMSHDVISLSWLIRWPRGDRRLERLVIS